MKRKVIGIFVCMLLIATALSAIGVTNVQTTQYVKENNYLEPYPSTSTYSPGVITIKIVAQVKEVYDPHNLLGGAIQVGDKIIGKYIYDSRTPDSEPDPHEGIYEYTSSPFGIEVKSDGFVFKTNSSDVDFKIFVYNDFDAMYPNQDLIFMASVINLPLSNGIIVQYISWRLDDPTGTALSNDALPTIAPVLSNWEQSVLGLAIGGWNPSDPSKAYYIRGNVTKATKSKSIARDVYCTTQPILLWLLERFPNVFPVLRYILGLYSLQ